MTRILDELIYARKAAGLTQAELAERAGLSRMTVQRTEAGHIDPRLSTLLVMARVLEMDIMLMPTVIRPALENFARSDGRFLGQSAGIDAPLSIVDELLRTPVRTKRPK